MTTALITHPDCYEHVTPPGHPEQVARLDAVLGALEEFDLLRTTAPMAAEDDLLRAHPKAHVDAVKAATPAEGWRSLDADTHMSQGTLAAAYRAAGGIVRAVDMVMAGEAQNAAECRRAVFSSSMTDLESLLRAGAGMADLENADTKEKLVPAF